MDSKETPVYTHSILEKNHKRCYNLWIFQYPLPCMHIYLTSDEQRAARKLLVDHGSGFTVQEETGAFQDSEEALAVRRSLVKFQDATLKELLPKLAKAATEAEAKALLEGVNMDALSDADIAEFFFLVGPEFVGLQIGSLLVSAASPQDVEAIAALSNAEETNRKARTLRDF